MAAVNSPTIAQEIIYPERDGKPMAETDIHREALADTIATLADFFRDDPDIYVAGNLLLYYEEGNPGASVAPDVFVVHGVPKRLRRTYKLWEEHKEPTVVIEVTSRFTRLEDLGTKRVLYESLGVQEYFLFDPLDEYLHPPLQGYRLVDGEYVRLGVEPDGALMSQTLGMRLQRENNRLRLVNASTGEPLLWPDEVATAHRAEAAARRAVEERLLAVEDELAQLRAEVARLRQASSGDNTQD
jgi:Uma2 family endonuclease